jgi:tetratricopeptide (TPR) repeat protein
MPLRLLVCAAFLALPSLSRAQYMDSIPMGARTMEGEVQRLTNLEVGYVPPGGGTSVITIKRESITGDIAWDETSIPPAMNNGRSQFGAGKYPEAAANFAKAYASAGTRQVLKQECAFKMAEAHRLSMNFGEAALAYQKLLKDFQDSFYIKEAYSAIVDCFMYGTPPNYSEARKYIAEISAKAKDLGLPEDFVGELKLKDARMYERQGQSGPALGVYNGLLNHKTPRVQWAAWAGLGTCQLLSKEYDKAKASFQKVIDNADLSQASTLGRAYNGLGECLLTSGVNAENVKEALLCFLRTVTLYQPSGNDLIDDHAKAMMMGARCFHTLSDLATAPEEKDKLAGEYQKLAGRFNDTYGGDFPNWLKAVKEPLGK